MQFEQYHHFVNPARTNVDLYMVNIATDGYLTTLALKNRSICLCLSPIYVSRSHLQPYHMQGDKQLKSLECVFHSYEWERSTSLFCMVFGVDSLQGQLNGGAISIATRPSASMIINFIHSLWIKFDIIFRYSWCKYVSTGYVQWYTKSKQEKSECTQH